MPLVAVVQSIGYPVDAECGEVHILAPFLRGDCNGDGNINIGDPIFLINELFAEGPQPTCDDACDGNDDGSLNTADAIYGLNYLFAEGPAPPEPYLDCGSDPTADELDCADPLLECP